VVPQSGSSSTESNWNLGVLVFIEGGKPENPEINPRSKGENQRQTQLAYDTESESQTRVTVVRGERSHRYATNASHIYLFKMFIIWQFFNCGKHVETFRSVREVTDSKLTNRRSQNYYAI
jgi:hypothetical protein